MTTINPSAVLGLLQATFTDYHSATVSVIAQLRLCKGTIPVSPATAVAAADIIDSAAVAISHSLFSAPSNGVVQMLNPLTVPIKASVTNAVPSFIRLQTSGAVGILDIPVSSSPGPDNAVISSMSISTGQSVQITSLGLTLSGLNDLVISPAYFNGLLRLLLGSPTAEGNANRLMGTWAKVINSSAAEANAVLAIEAYDGAVPTTHDETPVGTLLWKRTIPTTEVAVLSVVGSSIFSNRTHQASALATGTPTFIRVVKNAITSGTNSYPRLCIQLTTDKHVGFYQSSMVTGVVNTLDQFNLSLLS